MEGNMSVIAPSNLHSPHPVWTFKFLCIGVLVLYELYYPVHTDPKLSIKATPLSLSEMPLVHVPAASLAEWKLNPLAVVMLINLWAYTLSVKKIKGSLLRYEKLKACLQSQKRDICSEWCQVSLVPHHCYNVKQVQGCRGLLNYVWYQDCSSPYASIRGLRFWPIPILFGYKYWFITLYSFILGWVWKLCFLGDFPNLVNQNRIKININWLSVFYVIKNIEICVYSFFLSFIFLCEVEPQIFKMITQKTGEMYWRWLELKRAPSLNLH